MKININREFFAQTIKDVNRVKKIAAYERFNCIKITVYENSINIIKNNGELSISKTITSSKENNLRVDEVGETLIKADFLNNILNKLSGENIGMAVDPNQNLLKINSNKAHFKLATLPSDHFFKISQAPLENSFKIKCNKLTELVDNTLHCVSKEESRPALTGIKFIAKGNKIKAVATDSICFAQRTVELDNSLSDPLEFLIPGNNLKQIIPLLNKDESETVNVGYTKKENMIFFQTCNGISIQSRLLECCYPNTSFVDNAVKNVKSSLKIGAKTLHDVLVRSTLTANKSQNQSTKICLNEDNVKICNDNNDIGSFDEKLDGAIFRGKPMTILLNPSNMIKGLVKLGHSEVEIDFQNETLPIVFFDAVENIKVKKEVNNSNLNLTVPLRSN
ncbi:DNA polymerase III subunit beta [Apilactobacillus timberlakei]|uniref:DNA polymerase III subunit beta n=1 Tax=Apilactobacillus timberlakei TaxID=2008380 RepID=UPI001128B421|nr:DNA polymerase III subunit beta [Apilactobacillus timberlakei]TPR15046.1 DNA polymerase III subunit beta [Apilactobacillus timberlakei]